MANDASTKFIFYQYNPSMVAAIIFIIIFAFSASYHSWQLARNRTWYFIPFLIGCLFEFIGYIGRAMSAHEAPDFTKNPYIIQSLMLLVGPTLYAASIYMILGRLVVLLEADNYSMIKPRWLTKFFVLGDVLSFFAQSGGGGILATAKDSNTVKRGENVILGGLGIQILFFGFFIVVTLVFHIRIGRRPTSKSIILAVPWKSLIWVLYASSTLIMVRSIFRVAEYVTGRDGVLQSNEVYLYLLDGLQMFIVAALFNWFHPSRVVNREAQLVSASSIDVLEHGHMMDQQTKDRYALASLAEQAGSENSATKFRQT
ncbi:RTA1-domain-containing protein [Whalleya microplaca]|nr:RTA1-domain-containing protein [Whalleya microplaca]